ncbi:MAG: DUF488 domain-containing protein [Usitatibacter sp.]
MTMALPFFTIGHSTRSLDEFVALLRANGVERVIDVRAIPRSRTNPQFNEDSLPRSLAPFDFGYEHIAALGGLRHKVPGAAPETNAYWENDSFHNYADYTATEEFRRGFARLKEAGESQRCVVMCAETVWWRCHRRIITDYLLAAGEDVWHIMGIGKVEAAKMTPGAKPGPNGILEYPFALS